MAIRVIREGIPGRNHLAIAINEKVQLDERIHPQFHTGFLNLTNRAQFAAPGIQARNANFGVATAASNNPRPVQFTLRLAF